MSEQPASPLRFVGVPGTQLRGEYFVGETVVFDYEGVSYTGRVTSRVDDYDDFGTQVTRYDLEARPTSPQPPPG